MKAEPCSPYEHYPFRLYRKCAHIIRISSENSSSGETLRSPMRRSEDDCWLTRIRPSYGATYLGQHKNTPRVMLMVLIHLSMRKDREGVYGNLEHSRIGDSVESGAEPCEPYRWLFSQKNVYNNSLCAQLTRENKGELLLMPAYYYSCWFFHLRIQDVCQQILATLYDYPCLKDCRGLITYVGDSVRLAWALSTQTPPYRLVFISFVQLRTIIN